MQKILNIATTNNITALLAGLKDPKFIFDDFPRNLDSWNEWTRIMDGFCDLRFVVLLECGEGVCVYFSSFFLLSQRTNEGSSERWDLT